MPSLSGLAAGGIPSVTWRVVGAVFGPSASKPFAGAGRRQPAQRAYGAYGERMSKTGLNAVLNRLAKWRSTFAGWQLGTRTFDDPESQAVRDHREATIMLRAEVSTLTALLLSKKVFSVDEMQEQLQVEALALMAMYEKHFPGFTAVDDGMQLDARAIETMSNWRP
jgi:hypothetical protein